MDLDKKSRAILRNLQARGRMTNVELAGTVDLSPPPCLRRIQSLEKAGYIKGYHADIDPMMLGFEVMVSVRVKLARDDHADHKAFRAFVKRTARIIECYQIAGIGEYLLKAVAKDQADFEGLHQDIMALPCVSWTTRSMIVDCTKQTFGPPV